MGSRNRVLLSLGCSSLSRTGLVDRISAELSPITSLQLFYLFPFPCVSFPTPKYCLIFLLGPCHTFLPETSTIVLCKQCPIFIIILIHTQAALGVVSPRKASDHPSRNSQAPQNCAEERAVNHLCILLSADRCRASYGARSAVWTLQEALVPREIRCHRCI